MRPKPNEYCFQSSAAAKPFSADRNETENCDKLNFVFAAQLGHGWLHWVSAAILSSLNYCTNNIAESRCDMLNVTASVRVTFVRSSANRKITEKKCNKKKILIDCSYDFGGNFFWTPLWTQTTIRLLLLLICSSRLTREFPRATAICLSLDRCISEKH